MNTPSHHRCSSRIRLSGSNATTAPPFPLVRVALAGNVAEPPRPRKAFPFPSQAKPEKAIKRAGGGERRKWLAVPAADVPTGSRHLRITILSSRSFPHPKTLIFYFFPAISRCSRPLKDHCSRDIDRPRVLFCRVKKEFFFGLLLVILVPGVRSLNWAG